MDCDEQRYENWIFVVTGEEGSDEVVRTKARREATTFFARSSFRCSMFAQRACFRSIFVLADE